MFTIEIYYTTGNSFGSHEETDYIGYSFDTREEARIVLTYIKEHYEMYEKLNEWGMYKQREERIKPYINKPWFIPITEKDNHSFEYGINYKDRRISCFWCGYFETLHYAKIVHESLEEDEDAFYV